jgi:transposase-like protein
VIGLALHATDRPVLIKGRHFEAEIIIFVRSPLSSDMRSACVTSKISWQSGLFHVDHVTIWRWIQRYAPELNRRCRQELRITNRLWRVDETYLRVAGEAEMNKGLADRDVPGSTFEIDQELQELLAVVGNAFVAVRK